MLLQRQTSLCVMERLCTWVRHASNSYNCNHENRGEFQEMHSVCFRFLELNGIEG